MALECTAHGSRFEGRLFSDEGRLYLVLDVDTESGFARVSCRVDGEQLVLQMPVTEVGLRLSTSSSLLLDGLNSQKASGRIVQQNDGWFFATREGLKGPYKSDAQANQALKKHTLSFQGTAESHVKDRAVNLSA